LRALQRHSTVPEVVTSSADISVREKGQQHQRALPRLREMPRQVVVPGVVTYGAAISGCDAEGRRSQQDFAPDVSTRSAAFSAGEKGPAGPSELTSLKCDAALCHRAGCGHLLRCHKRVRKGQQHQQASHLVRATRRHAIVPEVSAYSAAISVCDERQQHR